MCPWKNGEQVTAQWVIPGWPEADEHLACRLQERVHDTQDSRRVGEMLKGVQGNDDVRKLLRRRYEETSILDTVPSAFCLAAWRRSSRISIPITRWAPSSSHLYGFSPFATAEVDDNFPCNLGEEF